MSRRNQEKYPPEKHYRSLPWAGLLDDELTTTRESWHNGTYSHEWGTSPIVGVVWGIMGIRQTAPGFATFTVSPTLGRLQNATIKLPTLRGPIAVTARPGVVEVAVPCNTRATLCVPGPDPANGARARGRGRGAAEAGGGPGRSLFLDGAAVDAAWVGGRLCTAEAVGCGRAGQPRVLRAGSG